jgi:hypothetical protein
MGAVVLILVHATSNHELPTAILSAAQIFRVVVVDVGAFRKST